MKRWACVVVALYVLMLVVFTIPVTLLAFAPKANAKDVIEVYLCFPGAGVMTFIGLTLGISVMLFSFVPAVFFLYAERWRRLHPEAASELEQPI